MSFLIEYVARSVFVREEELQFRGNIIHILLLAIFVINNIIFCKILSDHHISNKIRVYVILELIFNFISITGLCSFFKYINDTVENRVWKGVFYCCYDNSEEYYLFGVKTQNKLQSFYFGSQIYGMICIMIVFAIIPLLSHIIGYYLYTKTHDDNMLLIIGNIGNMILLFRTVGIFILFVIYRCIMMIYECCFIEIGDTIIHDENIALVTGIDNSKSDYGSLV